MEIHGTTPSMQIAPRAAVVRRSPNTPARSDQVETSRDVRMLARNLPALKEQLLPRSDIMSRFEGIVEQPLDLDDATIDRILSRL